MRFPILFNLALSSIRNRTVRSLVTIVSITISLSIIIIALGFAQGLQKIIDYEINQADTARIVRVTTSAGSQLQLDSDAHKNIAALNSATQVEEVANLSGTLAFNNVTLSVPVYAVSEKYLELQNVSLSAGKTWQVTDRSTTTTPAPRQLMLNQAALTSLSLPGSGDILNKTMPVSLTIPRELAPTQTDPITSYPPESFTVVGITSGTDQPLAYILKDEIQDTYKVTNASEEAVLADSITSVPQLRQDIEQFGYHTDSILDTLNQVDLIFRVLRLIVIIMGVITLAVATLGTFNTITVALIEQTPEIAFLRILGFSRGSVHTYFILQAVLLCLGGALGGLAVGLGVGYGINYYVGNQILGQLNAPLAFFAPTWSYLVALTAFIALLGWLVGLAPARRAAKIEPLLALRQH